MSDEADRSDHAIELDMQDRIFKAALVKRLEPTGACYNCGVSVEHPHIYCDSDCEKDHRWYIERTK